MNRAIINPVFTGTVTFTGATIVGLTVPGAVLYDQAQSLDSDEKLQARDNIGLGESDSPIFSGVTVNSNVNLTSGGFTISLIAEAGASTSSSMEVPALEGTNRFITTGNLTDIVYPGSSFPVFDGSALHYPGSSSPLADDDGRILYHTGDTLTDGGNLFCAGDVTFSGLVTDDPTSTGRVYSSDGVLILSGYSIAPTTYDTGWTANADGGTKTASIGSTATIAGMVAALNIVSPGLGTQLAAIAEKVKALENALSNQFLPNV